MLTPPGLVDEVSALCTEAARLRRELDDARGVPPDAGGDHPMVVQYLAWLQMEADLLTIGGGVDRILQTLGAAGYVEPDSPTVLKFGLIEGLVLGAKKMIAGLTDENARLVAGWPEDGPRGVRRRRGGWEAYPAPGVVRTFKTKREAVGCLVEQGDGAK